MWRGVIFCMGFGSIKRDLRSFAIASNVNVKVPLPEFQKEAR